MPTATPTYELVPTFTPTRAQATLTPKPTRTPTPVPSPLPTRPPLPKVVVDRANLRAGPGTVYAVVGTLDQGTSVRPLQQTRDGQWIRLSNDRWLFCALVDGVPDAMPVADAIPPTPVPTFAPVPTFTPIPRDWIAPAVLSQAYERNEPVANQQYQGKRLKVSEQVETVRLNPSGVPYIEFVDASPIGAYYFDPPEHRRARSPLLQTGAATVDIRRFGRPKLTAKPVSRIIPHSRQSVRQSLADYQPVILTKQPSRGKRNSERVEAYKHR